MELVVLLAIVTFSLCYLYKWISRRKLYPPGPIKFPFIGNGSLVKKYSQKLGGLHNSLNELCKQYKTDVLSLKLGADQVVVIQNESLLEEVLMREEFQGRPDTFFIRLRSMGTRKGITMTDGSLWHEQRAFAVKHMHNLGLGKSQMEYLIHEEIQDMFKTLKDGGLSVNLRNHISKCVLNVLWAMVTGNRFANEDTLESLVKFMSERAKAFDMAGGVLCQFPWIRFIAPKWSGFSLIQNLNLKFKSMITEIIDQHKSTYKKDTTRDFIDAFLHEMYSKQDNNSTFTEDQLIMVCLDFFIAGSQTTSSSLDFALLHMLLFPEIQRKVQEEIDSVLKPGQPVSLADKPKLPFLEAVILESQRMSHVVPVIGPRRVLSDTTLGGYHIPKGTTILMNLVPLSKNPEKWEDPNDFKPERFLDEYGHVSYLKSTYSFGKGKRRCPGEPLAKSFIFIFFTCFLQRYRIEVKEESNRPTLDYIPGLTLSPLPYEIKLTKRT